MRGVGFMSVFKDCEDVSVSEGVSVMRLCGNMFVSEGVSKGVRGHVRE